MTPSLLRIALQSLLVLATVQLDLIIALAAIDWSAVSRLKWHLSFLTASGTDSWECLATPPWTTKIAGIVSLRSFCLSTRRAALGVISIPLGSEEFLFLGGEGEIGTTITAIKQFVCRTHLDDLLSSDTSWLECGHPSACRINGRFFSYG